MKKNLLLAAILLFGYSVFAQNTNTLVNNYIGVKNALVNSDAKTAKQTINSLYQSIKEESNFKQKESLLKSTEKMVKADNIEKQREAFNTVSTTLWDIVKNSEKINHTVYYQYCPMKKAYWLSTEKEIKNPYYGAAMLSCGSVVATK
ncbi:hypothetical protein GCM10008015_16940 [Flavobacterium palustre]|uniref:DUF3347 domain-containing protein n=1 Tax=Flavobacterium palustre TaxID=1476463 RepID=A0ABQ1HHX5_9FLAO|nr:DUF3347 domain-containing protein [Flavobacterium palustre]GGA76946.1 hypothetical protein GCM10008015_16940 [Flavobacterium palustre]